MKLKHLFQVSLVLLLNQPAISMGDTQEDTQSTHQGVTLDFEDIAFKMIPIESGFKILFEAHAAVYYLKKNAQNYESLQQIFIKNLKNHKKLKIKVDPNTLEIKEAF